MNNMRNCDLCGTDENVEFIITSKHCNYVLPEVLKKLNTTGTSHIAKHICKKCFIKLFDKGANK